MIDLDVLAFASGHGQSTSATHPISAVAGGRCTTFPMSKRWLDVSRDPATGRVPAFSCPRQDSNLRPSD